MIFGSSAPLIGEQRERIVFAWFPIRLDDNRIAWLSKVRVMETARPVCVIGAMGYTPIKPGERGEWVLESAVLA